MLEKLKNLKRASKEYEKRMKKLDKQFARLDKITSSLKSNINLQTNTTGGYYGYSNNISQ